MDFDVSRLRRGELLAGASAVALVVFMFALHWYGSLNGWQALTVLRWAIVLTALLAFGLVLAQVACRAPAIPVSLSVVVTVVSLIAVLWLAIHVITMPAHQKATVLLGLASAIGVFYGAYLSMRDEAITTETPSDIPVVRLDGP